MSAENSLDNRSGRNQVGKQRRGGWSHAMSELARKPAESSHALHTVSGPSAGPAIELAREKHYSIIEIAELWALSEKTRSEEHTSELQSRPHLVCRLLLV